MTRHDLTNVLIAWWERHHPDHDLDPDLWARTLSRLADPTTLAHALDTWSIDHPTQPPAPGPINELIRRPATARAAQAALANARAQITAAKERARTSDDETAWIRRIAAQTINPDHVNSWMTTRNQLLDDNTPLHLIHTGQTDRVADLLTALADGVTT